MDETEAEFRRWSYPLPEEAQARGRKGGGQGVCGYVIFGGMGFFLLAVLRFP
jgi:hypothetical protein